MILRFIIVLGSGNSKDQQHFLIIGGVQKRLCLLLFGCVSCLICGCSIVFGLLHVDIFVKTNKTVANLKAEIKVYDNLALVPKRFLDDIESKLNDMKGKK